PSASGNAKREADARRDSNSDCCRHNRRISFADAPTRCCEVLVCGSSLLSIRTLSYAVRERPEDCHTTIENHQVAITHFAAEGWALLKTSASIRPTFSGCPETV